MQLRTVLALVGVFASAMLSIPSRVEAAAYVPQSSNRKVLNFNTHWLFAGDVPDTSGRCTDPALAPVSLPYFRTHLHKGFVKTEYESVSWYCRHFSLPSSYSGRRIAIEFQGVAKVADVYVNGTWVGQHKGAYTSFTFDVTSLVSIGGADNIVAVRVDSNTRADIPPEGGSIDYYVWGGIVRDVNLIITDPLHVDWAFITTPSVSATSATVNARTSVRNDSGVAKSVTVITNVVDASNNVVATGAGTTTIRANATVELNYNTTAVGNPNRWHPESPYLYTVYTQVKDGAAFVDEHRVRLGIRSILFNGMDGKFYINGQSLKLRGLDRHEAYPYIGRAAPNRLQVKDADMLKFELGINMVRTSHYPQDPEFLDRADEIGLLVLEEIPGWQFVGDVSWQAISIQNVREMVMRDRNHPSIVLWGVRINESGDNHDFYTQTNNLARELDPSRPTGGIRNFRTSEFLEDVYTYNDFSGGAQDPDPARLPWLITEAVGGLKQNRSWDPESTLVDTLTAHLRIQNESYQKANIAGALNWAFADYNTTFANDTCLDFTCYHGVYDIFRLPKFSASAFASQRDPARYGAYVAINNYHQSTSASTVLVGGNCSQVELFANGVSQGRINPNAYTSLPHPFFQFGGVTTAAGSLRADCWIGGSVAATTTRFTPGTAIKLLLTPDDAALQADGADMTRVVVKAVDANNQVVPYDASRVSFSLSGPGAVIGENPLILEGGQGAVYVKAALGQTGTIALTASAGGMTSASATVVVGPFTAEIVPASGSYTFGFVIDINDQTQGTGAYQFNYVGGGWLHATGTGGLYNGDNSWSSTVNDTVTLPFGGTRAVLYGVLDPGHGTGAVSIDGGAETTVSFVGSPRRGNVALWTSPVLAQGTHTFKVRVVSGAVVLDRVSITTAPPAVLAPPPSGPIGFSYCAPENGTCAAGTASVAYGALGAFFYQAANGSIGCDNGVFGDPIQGVPKACYVAGPPAGGGPSGFAFCALETGSCAFSGTGRIAFGANGLFNFGNFVGGVSCTNGIFGDPVPGTRKACYYQKVAGPTPTATAAATATSTLTPW